jgi:hypothetical protein
MPGYCGAVNSTMHAAGGGCCWEAEYTKADTGTNTATVAGGAPVVGAPSATVAYVVRMTVVGVVACCS